MPAWEMPVSVCFVVLTLDRVWKTERWLYLREYEIIFYERIRLCSKIDDIPYTLYIKEWNRFQDVSTKNDQATSNNISIALMSQSNVENVSNSQPTNPTKSFNHASEMNQFPF